MKRKLFALVVAASLFAMACSGDGTQTSSPTLEPNTATSQSDTPVLSSTIAPTTGAPVPTNTSPTTAATPVVSPAETPSAEVPTDPAPGPTSTLASTTVLTPTMVTLTASQDNTLYEFDAGSFSNGAGMHTFVGLTNTGLIRRSLIKFDISGDIPAGSVITNVTLTLNMSKTAADAETIDIHNLLADWGEGSSDADVEEGSGAFSMPGDATWIHGFFPSTKWVTPGGDFSATTSASITVEDEGSYVWGPTDQMTADVQA